MKRRKVLHRGFMLTFAVLIGLFVLTTGVQAQSYECIEMVEGECDSVSGGYVSVNVIEADIFEDNTTGEPKAVAVLQVDTYNASHSTVNLNLDGLDLTVSSETPGYTEVTMVREYNASEYSSPREVYLEISVGTNTRNKYVGTLSHTEFSAFDPPEEDSTLVSSSPSVGPLQNFSERQTLIPKNEFSNMTNSSNFTPSNIIQSGGIFFNYSAKTPPSRFVDGSGSVVSLENRNIPPYKGNAKGEMHNFYNLRYTESPTSSVITSSSSHEINAGLAFHNMRKVSERRIVMEYSMSGLDNFDPNMTFPSASGKIKSVDAFGNQIDGIERSLVETQSTTPVDAYSGNSVSLTSDRERIEIELSEEALEKINTNSQMYVLIEAENTGALEIYDVYTQGATE